MSEVEKIAMLIDAYANLQRIKFADDRDKEIDYQRKVWTFSKSNREGLVETRALLF